MVFFRNEKPVSRRSIGDDPAHDNGDGADSSVGVCLTDPGDPGAVQ